MDGEPTIDPAAARDVIDHSHHDLLGEDIPGGGGSSQRFLEPGPLLSAQVPAHDLSAEMPQFFGSVNTDHNL